MYGCRGRTQEGIYIYIYIYSQSNRTKPPYRRIGKWSERPNIQDLKRMNDTFNCFCYVSSLVALLFQHGRCLDRVKAFSDQKVERGDKRNWCCTIMIPPSDCALLLVVVDRIAFSPRVLHTTQLWLLLPAATNCVGSPPPPKYAQNVFYRKCTYKPSTVRFGPQDLYSVLRPEVHTYEIWFEYVRYIHVHFADYGLLQTCCCALLFWKTARRSLPTTRKNHFSTLYKRGTHGPR